MVPPMGLPIGLSTKEVRVRVLQSLWNPAFHKQPYDKIPHTIQITLQISQPLLMSSYTIEQLRRGKIRNRALNFAPLSTHERSIAIPLPPWPSTVSGKQSTIQPLLSAPPSKQMWLRLLHSQEPR